MRPGALNCEVSFVKIVIGEGNSKATSVQLGNVNLFICLGLGI